MPGSAMKSFVKATHAKMSQANARTRPMTTPTLKEAREAMVDALRACIRAASPEQQAELLKVVKLYRSVKAMDAALRAAPDRGHMISENSEGRGIQGKGQFKAMNQ